MNLPIALRRAAREEFDKAGDYYERRRPGLGERFTSTVELVFERIRVQPEVYPIVLRDIRKAVVPGFPFCIYYRMRTTSIVVLSVFHTSRDPAIWQSRN